MHVIVIKSIALFSHSAAQIAITIQTPYNHLIESKMWKIDQLQEMHR